MNARVSAEEIFSFLKVVSKEEGNGLMFKLSMIPWSSGKFSWNFSKACSELTNWMSFTRDDFFRLSSIKPLCVSGRFFSRKKTRSMFFESCLAVKLRLLERERKTPNVRKDRQIIVIEKMLRTLNCHRLLSVSFRKYLNFWIIRVVPF